MPRGGSCRGSLRNGVGTVVPWAPHCSTKGGSLSSAGSQLVRFVHEEQETPDCEQSLDLPPTGHRPAVADDCVCMERVDARVDQ